MKKQHHVSVNKNAPIITPSIIAKEVGIDKNTVIRLIAAKKLKPQSSVPYATGYMHMYERAVLEPLVREWIAAQQAKIKPASAPPVVADQVVSLTELAKHLAINDATLDGMSQALGALDIKVDQLREQNVIIHRTLAEMRLIMNTIAKELNIQVPA